MADRPDPRPPPAVFLQHHQIFLNQPLRERVHGHVADFVALALDAEMDDALAALHSRAGAADRVPRGGPQLADANEVTLTTSEPARFGYDRIVLG